MRRSTIMLFLAMMLVMLGWTALTNWLRQQHPEWKTGQEETQQADNSQPATTPATTPSTTRSTTGPAAIPATAPAVVHETAMANWKPAARSLGGDDNDTRHVMRVDIAARGAGLTGVTLKKFAATVDPDSPKYTFQAPYDGSQHADRSMALAARWIEIDGKLHDISHVDWSAGPATETRAEYGIVMVDEKDKPLVEIRKIFELRTAQGAAEGAEYELQVRYELTARQKCTVKLGFNGTNTPVTENNRDIAYIVVGSDVNGADIKIDATVVQKVNAKEPSKDLKDEKLALKWVGMSSNYWDAIVLPEMPANGLPVASATAEAVTDGSEAPVAVLFQTAATEMAPGQQATAAMSVFMGPKQRALLNGDYYSAFPRMYDKTLVMAQGLCGICTFAWLIGVLVKMLTWFHFLTQDWGLAIIVLVLLVRLLLHPVTKQSQVAMSRMQKMGPEMERLKKKHADDAEALRKAQMEMMREQGVGMYLGCLPMFLQMPIWIALYAGLQSTFELRHEPFLHFFGHTLTWIKDLAQPDRLIPFGRSFKFFILTFDAINILPILMAVVFFLQQKYMPKPPAATDQQRQQQKLMQWLTPFMFPIFLYTSPAGLNLYIITSTSIGIWESKRIRRHIKEREDAATAGKVIVDAPASRGARRMANDRAAAAAATEPAGCMGGWMANIQSKVEEIQRQQQKGKPKR